MKRRWRTSCGRRRYVRARQLVRYNRKSKADLIQRFATWVDCRSQYVSCQQRKGAAMSVSSAVVVVVVIVDVSDVMAVAMMSVVAGAGDVDANSGKGRNITITRVEPTSNYSQV